MDDQVLALLGTAGWVLLVGVILALFGTTEGGAWSIAGGVARGVRDWAASRGEPSPATSPVAETEDL